MKIWILNKLLTTLLKMNRFNGLYLNVWRLYHIEKGNIHRARKNS